MIRPTILCAVSLALVALGPLGCSRDERLVKQAETASNRQADQNREIARQNQELAQATNRLVTADAQARHETLSLQRELQAEQAAIGQQRDELEQERRQIADQRHRDPLLAAVLTDLGLLLACLLPLVLCGYLIHGLRREPDDLELAELLTVELVSDSPLLLPPGGLPSGGPAALAQPTIADGREDDRQP